MNEMFEDPDSILLRQNPSLHTGRETALHYLQHFQLQIAQTLPNYKQILCPRFEKYGFCRYSDFCIFAHGMDDLLHPGEIERLNLYYKTIMCSNSFPCPFGENCQYAHTTDEIRNISDNIKMWKSSLKVVAKSNLNPNAVPFSSSSDSSLSSAGSNSSTISCSTKTVLNNNSDLNPNAIPFFSPKGKVFNKF